MDCSAADVTLSKGLGARHWAAAAISRATNAISITVSQSNGTVRIFQNGEQVLINMKPGKDKWSGRILDPTSGSTYDSTIALKGTDSLRVQGCAFGGMFCGGQTWTRVN